ncbi:MAG TPA: hypothetical protein VHP34_11675 [Alphaproteobacteria bacterium]|nr:hypothetical protein [Alphaproteobacteria bacterium]
MITNPDMPDNVVAALKVAKQFSQIDGVHHKQWSIDQMVRALLVTDIAYEQFVREYETGEDGPRTYQWSVGIAP